MWYVSTCGKEACKINLNEGEIKMPVVQVDWLVGRDAEKKKKLIQGIAKAFEDVGVPKEHLDIIIRDIPKTDWGKGDTQMSELRK